MIGLIVLIVVVALLVWVLEQLPFLAPFSKIIRVVALIVVIAAILQTFFGVDLIGEMRNLGHR